MVKHFTISLLCACILVACSNNQVNSSLFDESKFSNNGTLVHYDGDLSDTYTYVVDSFDAVANKSKEGGYDITWNHLLYEGDHTLQIKENGKVIYTYNFNWTSSEDKNVIALCVTNDNFTAVLARSTEDKDIQYTINGVKVRPIETFINGEGYYCIVFKRDTVSDGDNTVSIVCDDFSWEQSITIEDEQPKIIRY